MLTNIGFNEKEIAVYLTLLKKGYANAGALAKATGISRPTVYNVVQALVAKGVIVENLAGKSAKFAALPPDNLRNLLKVDQALLVKKEQVITEAIQFLSNIQLEDTHPVPHIRYIEEKRLKDYLHEATLRWDKSGQETDKTWWGFQDHTLVEQYERYIHWFWKNVAQDTEVKLLTNHSAVERRMNIYHKYAKRHIKLWNQAGHFNATTWVVGEYVIMVITSKKPMYLVEIHDATYAESQRNLFRGIWEELK